MISVLEILWKNLVKVVVEANVEAEPKNVLHSNLGDFNILRTGENARM